MLKNNIFTFRFLKFIQSGLYLDFFLKKLIESYTKNLLIYSSQFFGEKYIIEYLTKKIIDSVVFNNNFLFSFLDLSYSMYFIQILSFFIYFFTLLNIFILI